MVVSFSYLWRIVYADYWPVSLAGLRKSTTAVVGGAVLPVEGVVPGPEPEVVAGGVTPWPPWLLKGIL
jgi:hypothetical protein